MQIAELRNILSTLEQMLERAQASKSMLRELGRFNASLSHFDDLSVADFSKNADS